MALVKCPECGREKVSDSAEACPDCGYGIKQYYIQKKEEEKQHQLREAERKREIEEEKLRIERIKFIKEKNKKKKELAEKIIKKLVPVVIIAIIVITGIFVYLKIVEKNRIRKEYEVAYREAINIYETENYEKAMQDFMELGDFKDSKEYIEKCKISIPLKKYANGCYIQAYQELILLSPETFDRVMSDSGISMNNLLYECRKKCADLGYEEYMARRYIEAADYFAICYEYDTVSYKKEYTFTTNVLAMMGKWYYFKSGQEIYEGYFFIKNDIETLGIESLGVKEGHYEYEEKDGAIYIPDLDMAIYPPKVEGLDNLGVLKGNSSYTYIFYNNMNYMKDKAIENIKKNEKKEPKIGMTTDEVEASTWGKPEKINKTTYKWGITEQWVYSGYRYIYFDNGRVTAISE